MLKLVKSNYLIKIIYILLILFVLSHLGSDVNLIIMLESLLCFTILVYLIKENVFDLKLFLKKLQCLIILKVRIEIS